VFERLASLEDEFISLEVSLGDPDVMGDHEALRRVSKRYKDLTPVVDCLRAHRERERREPSRDPVELPELLEWVDPRVRVRADADGDAALENALDGEVAVTEVRLGRGADADARAVLSEEVELRVVGVRRMDDRRPQAQKAVLCEQFDGPDAVLLDAVLDLPRLLVGVHVKRQPLRCGVATDLLEPVGGAGAHGVGGEPDSDAGHAQCLDFGEIGSDRGLPRSREPSTRVRDVEQHERDSRVGGGVGGGVCLGHAEVVELADRGESRCAHLSVCLGVGRANELGRLPVGFGKHSGSPGPEVGSRSAAAQRALERMAVRVHESRQLQRAHESRRYQAGRA
jgi:hypothetical protein